MIGDERVSEFAVSGNGILSRYRKTGGENGVPDVEIFEPRVVKRALLTG